MNMSKRSIVASQFALALFLAMSTLASAKDGDDRTRSDSSSRIQLFDSSDDKVRSGRTVPSKVERRSAKEIRQDRALFRSRQRMLRHEQNLWLGYDPARPQWSGIPNMRSHYSRPKIYIPVYVR